jgi:hypothetical protein
MEGLTEVDHQPRTGKTETQAAKRLRGASVISKFEIRNSKFVANRRVATIVSPR